MCHIMHMNGSCHTHMAVEIYLYVLQRMNCEWVMCVLLCVTSHIWMSHVTHTWQWRCMSHVCIICFMSHTWMGHVTHTWQLKCVAIKNDEWWMRRVTHMNVSCHTHNFMSHTYESIMSLTHGSGDAWVTCVLLCCMSHIWMGRVTHTAVESCYTHGN